MSVPAKFITPALTPPNPRIQLTNKDGTLTTSGSGSGLQVMQQVHQSTNGSTPTISCNCTNIGNAFTLTPLKISPKLLNYFSYWSFAFVASATSSGVGMTISVVPTTGSLPALPVFIAHGATPASAGDFTQNLFYVVYFVDSLNSGNGGFVIQA